MALTSRKITSFSKKVADLPDRPSPTFSASQIKAQFDSSPEETRVAINGVVDDLVNTTAGSSGAEQVGSAPITGVTGTTVYGQLSNIKTQLDTNANSFGKVAVSGQSDVVAEVKGDILNLSGGTGITVTTDPTSDTVTITATGNATPGAHASSHVTGGSDVIANAASGGNAGLMSGADKANLDTLSQKGAAFGVTAGTGTAYTVTATPAITSLSDGVSVAVKWHVVSGANPTIAVNGLTAKPVWKSNGNVPASGALKQDAIATLRYSSTANAGTGAFILQGEGGSGNAGTGDLLINKTATTDAGDIVGTMPSRTGDTAALSSLVSGTTLKLLASNGYRNGTSDYVTITDPDFIATNINQSVNIFGLVGNLVSYGTVTGGTANQLVNHSAVANITATDTAVYGKKLKEIKVNLNGVVRVTFTGQENTSLGGTKAKIYINGVARGTERSLANGSDTTPQTFTEDFSINSGDLVQIYGYTLSSSYTATVYDMKISITENPYIAIQV